MPDPQVAVIIPCFNHGAFVKEAVASVQATTVLTEMVIVDDCSTDEATHAVLTQLESEGVRVLRHDANRGPAAARNTGMAATTAPFVIPLDADDLVAPGAIDVLTEALLDSPDAAVAYGDYAEFGDHEGPRASPTTIDPYRLIYTNEYPLTVLWRRSALDAAGGWDTTRIEGRYYYEDWDLWMSVAEREERGVHVGAGVETFRVRVHGKGLLEACKRHHVPIYRALRAHHPKLFARRAYHRRRSGLSPARKHLYPLIYGGRRRFAFEPKIKIALERLGIWALRR